MPKRKVNAKRMIIVMLKLSSLVQQTGMKRKLDQDMLNCFTPKELAAEALYYDAYFK
jgi:hypothetical protein